MTVRDDTLSAIATQRFGLGARPGERAAVGADARGWLLEQVSGSYRAPDELAGLTPGAEVLAGFLAARGQRAAARRAARAEPGETAGVVAAVRDAMLPHYLAQAAARTRIALTTPAAFRERLVQFWTNHFAVSVDKPICLGTAGSLENEAIRPHVAGRFGDMLLAVETHPAMITYLDNQQSLGPRSGLAERAGRRLASTPARKLGLNENLAREILELHTLGVDGGYTQGDVTTFAAVLSGWSIGGGKGGLAEGTPGAFQFRAALHEPGAQVVLGRHYAEGGIEQGRAVLADLARHPSTSRHLATKLARHFVADEPPPALVEALGRAYLAGGGYLPAVYSTLLNWDGAWLPAPAKFKTPADFAYSALRALDVVPPAPRGLLAPFELLGQRHYAPGSPAGWPDRSPDWDGADALMKRIEWSVALAERVGEAHSALASGEAALGPLLGEHTRSALTRAASGSQAVALLLMSPEFQRR